MLKSALIVLFAYVGLLLVVVRTIRPSYLCLNCQTEKAKTNELRGDLNPVYSLTRSTSHNHMGS